MKALCHHGSENPRVTGAKFIGVLERKLGSGKGRTEKSNMKLTGQQQVLHHRGNYLVRRLRLAPGEATPWHRDPFHRVSVVLSGDLLNIEFRDGGETQTWKTTVGDVDWSEPSDRLHRAVNVGNEVFEEVVTFFLDRPDAVPQPEDDSK
jgi:quercetin dioxygenase-like cupin family protein